MKLKSIITLGICSILTGCTSPQIEDFNDTTPEFIPQKYFDGPMTAYGIVKDRDGKIIRRFKGKLVGSWDENGIAENAIFKNMEIIHHQVVNMLT